MIFLQVCHIVVVHLFINDSAIICLLRGLTSVCFTTDLKLF